MAQGFFVTGTDTGVGKTIASTWLSLHTSSLYWKPIQTGISVDPMDRDMVAEIIGIEQTLPTPFVYKEPLAPLHAAEIENTTVPIEDIVLPQGDHSLVVEGAGGVMVPITSTFFMTDLMAKLNLPIVVVARTTLGTINHTLLTLEALKRRSLPVAGIIFIGPNNTHGQRAIEHYGDVPIIGHIPILDDISKDNLHRIKPWINLCQI